jgi:SAM-dependent methyltransferase
MASLVGRHLDERTDDVHDHLERVEDRLAGLHEKLAALRVEELLARGPGALPGLGEEVGRFLNWAEGHEGYAAQAGLWFNPPVALDYRPGTVEARQVSERIVEQPFVFAALAGLTPPARVLDVGGSESTVGLSLAALGHDVTVVDPRGYPLAHPRLAAAVCRLDELDPAGGDFDAAVALSAIEHFGLGGYGEAIGGRLDLAALETLRARLRPGGLLALTVPFGAARVDEFERVYDRPGLDELLAGWEVIQARAAWQLDRSTWVAGELDDPLGPRGVALVAARTV